MIFSKKIIFPVSFVLILSLFLIGVWLEYSNYISARPKYLGEITMGWNKWPGVLPFLVAYEKGYFAAEGLTLKLKYEPSYTRVVQDLQDEKTDFSGAMAILDVVENADRGGVPLSVVSITDYSNGADGIIANGNVVKLDDLNGKVVAVEQGTLGEFLLHEAVRRAGLAESDVREINMSAEAAAKAYISGQVDAAVTYEPNLSEALAARGGNVIFSSTDAPWLIVDTMVFRSSYTDKNSEKVKAVMRAYFKAVDFINSNSTEAMKIGSDYFKITLEDFFKEWGGLRQFGYKENIAHFSRAATEESIFQNAQKACDFLISCNLIGKQVDPELIVNDRFLREIFTSDSVK